MSIPLSVLGIQTGGIVDIPEFEVLFESGSGNSGEESYGVVIETPNDVPKAILKLNELLLEARGGTSLIWRGEVLADIDALENADNTSETSLKRRPERWDMTVASGIVKARANKAEAGLVSAVPLQDLRRPMLSLNGFFRARIRSEARLQTDLSEYTAPIVIPQGVNLNFNANGEGFTLEPISDELGFIGGSVFEKNVFGTKEQFDQEEVDRLTESQPLLALLPDLDSADTAIDYVIEYTTSNDLDDDVPNNFEGETDESSNAEDATETGEQPDSNASSLIEFLLSVGVSAEDLAQVAGEDESIAEILVNATYNDPNGIESVQDAVGESTDLPSLSQMFVSIIGGDEAGVDLLVQVIAVSDELVNILDQTFKEDPDLNQQFIDRMTTSNAAFETLTTEAGDSPNTFKLLASVAESDENPVGLGSALLLNVLDSSEEARQNFVQAVIEDPTTLENIQTVIVEVDGLYQTLVEGIGLAEGVDSNLDYIALLVQNEAIASLLIEQVATSPETLALLVELVSNPNLSEQALGLLELALENDPNNASLLLAYLQETDQTQLLLTLTNADILTESGFQPFGVGGALVLQVPTVVPITPVATLLPPSTLVPPSTPIISIPVTDSPPDPLPTGSITSPSDGAQVTNTPTFMVSFSEPVGITGAWFSVSCGGGGTTGGGTTYNNTHYTITASGGTSFTLVPNGGTSLPNNTTCTVRVNDSAIRDSANQPMDTGNSSLSIVVITPDTIPPTATITSPSNGVFVTNTPNIGVTFSEQVNLATGWLSVVCGGGTSYSEADYVVSASGNSYTLTPNGGTSLPNNTTCTMTVDSSKVTDTSIHVNALSSSPTITVNTPDTIPPSVSAHALNTGSPYSIVNPGFSVTFSESVTLGTGWFSFACGGTTRTDADYTVSVSGASYTLAPTGGDFPANQTCNGVIGNSAVSDSFGNAIASNYTFTANTNVDAAPTMSVVQTGFIEVPGFVYLLMFEVRFSEAMVLPIPFTVENCGTAYGGYNNYDFNTKINISFGAAPPAGCQIRIPTTAADLDTIDPPDGPTPELIGAFPAP